MQYTTPDSMVPAIVQNKWWRCRVPKAVAIILIALAVPYALEFLSFMTMKHPARQTAKLIHEMVRSKLIASAISPTKTLAVGLPFGGAGCSFLLFEYWRGKDCSAIDIFMFEKNWALLDEVMLVPLFPCRYTTFLPHDDLETGRRYFHCGDVSRDYNIALYVYLVTEKTLDTGAKNFAKKKIAEMNYHLGGMDQ